MSTNDDRFGAIAVRQNMLSNDDLLDGLAIQNDLRTKGKEKLIGEILVERHWLNLRQVQKVLVEQQRLRQARGEDKRPGKMPEKIGPFKLIEKIGEGGMGAVYKVHDPNLDRVVALKILTRTLSDDREFIERFKREVKAAGALNHVNIVAAFGAGEIEGMNYLLMEFVDGESLRKTIKRLKRLPEQQALSIIKGVAQGLGAAHAKGFIHRDVKPDNILMGKNGAIKVADLGLAKSVDDDRRLTKTGIAIGTPHYISPEQARGEKQIDHRSDIYSLGATLYTCLTGRVPFEGRNNAEVMLKHLKEELENPQDIVPEISDSAVTIVMRMMAKRSKDRYRDCQELIEDLDKVLTGKSIAHEEVDVAESSIQLPKRKARRGGRARVKGSGGGCLVMLLPIGGLASGLLWFLLS